MSRITALQIDSREADWLTRWQTNPPAIFQDVPIVTAMLDTGDARVWCADGYVLSIERKTPSDFLSSIPNDHIFDQAGRMRIDYVNTGALPFLVITGEILRNPATGKCIIPGSKHGEGWDWNAVQGALLTIQEAGVPVLFCGGDMEYAPTLERLASRGKSVTVVNPTREIFPLTPQERVLCGLDGIGPELSEAILARCENSPAWALDFLTDLGDDLPKIPGVAQGRKRAIRGQLGLKDGDKLAVVSK
jgi:ERCC4-type nuclease